MGIPFIGGFAPNDHCRLDDAPLDVLAALGPLMQRLSGAVKSIPGVARAHFARWGDGSEHFHLWALARPLGMMQGRGAMLAFWDDVLPDDAGRAAATSTSASSPGRWRRRGRGVPVPLTRAQATGIS